MSGARQTAAPLSGFKPLTLMGFRFQQQQQQQQVNIRHPSEEEEGRRRDAQLQNARHQ